VSTRSEIRADDRFVPGLGTVRVRCVELSDGRYMATVGAGMATSETPERAIHQATMRALDKRTDSKPQSGKVIRLDRFG
jgi:hypothetical protein